MNIDSISSMMSNLPDVNTTKTENQLESFKKVFEESIEKSKNDVSGKQEENKELKEACQQFEAYFLYTMFKEMDKTVVKSDLIPEGRAEKMFKDMLYDEMATSASKGNGAGLADFMYKQMTSAYQTK